MVASVEVCLDSRQRVLELVSAMASMVESAIDQAIQALLAGDVPLAEAVLQREWLINRLEMHIDAAILAHLEHRHLDNDDIRSMASMLKINKDLERMGDLAANVARKVQETSGHKAPQRSDLQPMAILVSHISRKTLRALARHDLVLAESASGGKEALDNYRDYVFLRIHERLGGGSRETESDVALLLASRSLEQIADHAINLANNLLFWLRARSEGARVA